MRAFRLRRGFGGRAPRRDPQGSEGMDGARGAKGSVQKAVEGVSRYRVTLFAFVVQFLAVVTQPIVVRSRTALVGGDIPTGSLIELFRPGRALPPTATAARVQAFAPWPGGRPGEHRREPSQGRLAHRRPLAAIPPTPSRARSRRHIVRSSVSLNALPIQPRRLSLRHVPW